MEAGQGWTVLQRRQDGSEDFYRSWADYRRGFGNLSAEFWLGNDYIHRLTNQGRSKLRIDLVMFGGEASYAEYQNFSVADESSGYRLTAGTYSGTAGDALQHSRDQKFSTRDRDTAMRAVQRFRGAGWFSNTHFPSLNGVYYTPLTPGDGLTWMCKIKWCNGRKEDGLIKFVEMKITKTP
ncbi:ficolin-1-like [Branchiostoma floridae]|uniref:Ficolin-1-like n=1 Tax=Branchiostoma floridae TaxID=7739 RepID=A0A9J7LEG9_BRAFL|nr:ficolin-1-like [Branchiostoma floridae]